LQNTDRQWPSIVKKYTADFFEYQVRDKIIKQPLTVQSLSGTRIPKVVLPKYKDWGDILTLAAAGKCAG
jgi:methylmalonyl-CoA mutase